MQATAPNTGTYTAANQYKNVTDNITKDWLVTSQIDLSSTTNIELLFYSTQNFNSNYGSTYEVKVSTTSQTSHASFTTVANFDETNIGGPYEQKTIDLSAYDGMMIYVAFVHFNDDGDNWLIDDIEVRSPLNLDAQLNSVSLNRYSLTSTDNQLSVEVNNNGLTTITSLDISWNDGTDHSENFSVNIAAGDTQTLNHSTQVNYGAVVEENITVTITGVNGATDADTTNNTQSVDFNTMTQSGTKAVFIEEATGTWCGWCPRGAVGLDYMTSTYPNTVVGVAVHNSDPMEVAAYDAGIGQYINGYPSGVVDRKIGDVNPAQSSLQGVYDTQITEVVPSDVFAGATQSGNTLTISAQASFYTSFSNVDFRLGVIITEDGVTGTTNGYAQVNYYSGGSNGAMGGYESLPDPVPAAQMVYNHVGRALLGGFNGEPNSVPTSINAGDTVSHNFNYTIPSGTNVNDLHIVVVLIDQTDGSIVSAKQTTVAQALSVEDVVGISSIKVYPNPAKDVINVSLQETAGNYTFTVSDLLGRTVINRAYEGLNGAQNIQIPVSQLKSGHYILNINDGNASYSSKFIVK
ncbi:MAG: Omp28-related outer membrane protein [Winogradskyella sp.]